MKWYLNCWRNYATFSGRAHREEYWMFILFNFIFSIFSLMVDYTIGLQLFSSIYYLIVLIPGISVSVRRLHDIGKSGWWCWISCIPIIGFIWFIVLMCIDSEPGTNEYGENPKLTELNNNENM